MYGEAANLEPHLDGTEGFVRHHLNAQIQKLPPSMRNRKALAVTVGGMLVAVGILYHVGVLGEAVMIINNVFTWIQDPKNLLWDAIILNVVFLLTVGFVSYKKGKTVGTKNGIALAFRNDIQSYEPLVVNCGKFIEAFERHHLNRLGRAIVDGIGRQPESWMKYFEHFALGYTDHLGNDVRERWEVLAKATASQYSESTSRLRGGSNGCPPVLLSNFSMYAECVSSVFRTLLEEGTSFGNTVIVWTLLDKPLPVWYNMIRVSRGEFYCTQAWWEEYKKGVASLNYNSKFQMRRLVVSHPVTTKQKSDAPVTELYLLAGANPVSVSDARSMEMSGVDLTKDIHRLLCSGSTEFDHMQAYLIGRFNGSAKKKPAPPNSMSLVRHFQKTYHKQYKHNLKREEKGVFYTYVDNKLLPGDHELNAYLNFDDIFLVEFEESGGKVSGFGIALNIDEPNDAVGMKLLCGNELDKTREALMKKWNSGSDRIQ